MSKLFSETVKDLSAGQADIDIGLALAELTKSVTETAKGGKVTLTIAVAPLQKGNPEQLSVTYNVKVTKPTVQPGITVMFPTEDHALTRRDPRQPALPLRPVTNINEKREAEQ